MWLLVIFIIYIDYGIFWLESENMFVMFVIRGY